MKTSNKILITTGAIPLFCVFIFALVLKIRPPEVKYTDNTLVDKSSWTTKTFPLEEFDSILSKGAWDIHLVQADDYLIEIKAPEDIMNVISIKQIDKTLTLDCLKASMQSQNFSKVEARIYLPRLSGIDMQGELYLYFQELMINSISIRTQGLLKISATDSTVKDLSLTCLGMSKVDLSETPVTNADIRCGGIFSVEVLMEGGYLEAKLDGIGTLYCMGDVHLPMVTMGPFSEFVRR